MLIPDRMGVMILGEASLFPQAMMPLFIFEPRYREMLAESLESHRMFCLAMQRTGAKRESPCRIATLGLVRASVRNPNGTSNLVLGPDPGAVGSDRPDPTLSQAPDHAREGEAGEVSRH
ncbi:MAG: hypothetical protein RLZZ34_1605 [Verrucomicrobiota bacterium]